MAIVTSVLRGGTNNHETTAEEANAVYTDFVSEGIVGSVGNTSGVAPATGGFAVNAQGTPDATVAVSAGVAYVTGTPTSQNSQTFRVKNSASANVTISANSSGSTKYDWIYIKLDATALNTPNTAGDDVATLVASRSSSASTDDGTPPTYGYPLAVVTVANGFSTITNSNIRDVRTQVALNTGSSNAADGWIAVSGSLTTSTGYNKGNKEYDLTSSADLSAVLSPGMRLKVTRATTPPTQCADLETSSSQYATKSSPTGVSFTDDFTCEAWIKLESYAAMGIVSRYNGTSGWLMYLDANGRVVLEGKKGGASNYSKTYSFQSIPIGKWIHVAAVLDMSTFTAAGSPIYINGVSVPVAVERGGTNPTDLTQAGDLTLGGYNAAAYFDGKLSDVRVWSDIRTATEVRDNMNQQLVGNESNLVAYYKLNGDLNDSTSNANNLSASGGAAATNSDNPMNATEYAIITNVTSSTVTVFTGVNYNIPLLTLSTPYYSTQHAPFGFVADKGIWRVEMISKVTASKSSAANGTWYNTGTVTGDMGAISIPTGKWIVTPQTQIATTSTTNGPVTGLATISTASNTESHPEFTGGVAGRATVSTSVAAGGMITKTKPLSLSSQTVFYRNLKTVDNNNSTLYVDTIAESSITAECAY